MDVMMKAITEAYWIAKEKNKKFIPKSYKKTRLSLLIDFALLS